MEKIHGLIDAPFTPFYENGEVNYEPIEAYCQLLVRNGLQGVFINGSSGEGYMLTEDERMKLAERWMEVAPEGFKVIVHVGSTCVKSSKRLAEHAQKIGAWGIGAMAPPFPKVGRIEELVKYCEEIACGAPALPFYFYHIPAFNGAYLSMVAFLEAVDVAFLISPASNILSKACMNTTNAVYIKMANSTCCTARMKRSFHVWLWAVHRAVSVEQPTITAKNSQASSKHGKPVIWNWHANARISRRKLSMSSVTIVETSLAANAS